MGRVEIRIQTCLDESWSEWFDGFSISHPTPGETLMAGYVPDQAALYGLIATLRDLGVPLDSVMRRDPDAAGASVTDSLDSC